MTPVERRYSKEEIAQRGDAIYERDVKPRLTKEDQGKFVAIDIETSEFQIETAELAAVDGLRVRVPEAQIWLVRIGFPYVRRFGRREFAGSKN
ncbi:MAG: hypothetical protein WD872_05770 [Pirellulaceae bacterium]